MFRQIKISLISTCFMLLCWSFRHPYHLAVTTVSYNNVQKSLDVEVKLFYHDLELAVNRFGNTEIDIKHHSNKNQRDSLVYAYAAAHFALAVDGRPLTWKGTEVSFKDEYILIELTCNGAEGKSLSVKNTMCFETEPRQTNLFHFIAPGVKKKTKQTVNPAAEANFSL